MFPNSLSSQRSCYYLTKILLSGQINRIFERPVLKLASSSTVHTLVKVPFIMV